MAALVTIGMTLGLIVAASATAQATDSSQPHRKVVRLKKETDAVVTVVNKSFQTDVTSSVLEQFGLPANEGWSICFADPADPMHYTGINAYTQQNYLLVSAYVYDLKQGETRFVDTWMVQACTRTKITSPRPVSFMVEEPFHPTVETYLTKKNRCAVVFSNNEDNMTAELTLSENTMQGFFRNVTVAPGADPKLITLPRTAPKELTAYQSLYSGEKYGTYVPIDPIMLNTKTCQLFVSTSPIYPPAVG
jgi:hypothetical protein